MLQDHRVGVTRERQRLGALAPEGSWQRAAFVDIKATLLAGIWLGALVGGVGGRLAMLVLRVLSPDRVHGVISDDGFLIGQVTLKGTYDLIGLSAAIGIIGACAYRFVDRWLIGPGWFRQLTSALGAGAVVGSMLVHADGVDFTLLRPQWLAITFFVVIPALFGLCIGPLEKALARPDAWVNQGRRAWLVPVVTLLIVPVLILAVAFAAVVMLMWRRITLTADGSLRDRAAVGLVVRAGWLGVALLGAATLVDDATTILW
jgi:hypothetical protein